jgi:hypothetical protein
MTELAQQRREVFINYLKTFKKGEEPDLSDLPEDFLESNPGRLPLDGVDELDKDEDLDLL